MSNMSVAPLRSERRHTSALDLSLMGVDGKVIISTLPSGSASGADLFARLHPLERARFAAAPGTQMSRRLLLSAKDGGFLLFTGLLASCGVIIAAKVESASANALCHAAQICGFEVLKLRRAAKSKVGVLEREDINSATIFVSRMIEIQQLFENSGNIDLLSEHEAVELFNSFACLSGNSASVRFDGISDLSLLEGIDGKALGIAVIIASALTGEGKTLSVTLGERSKRLWAEIEFSPRKVRGRRKVDLDALERICGRLGAFECKNFSITQEGTTVRLTYSPTVFDPTAEGLMQGDDIVRKSQKKGLKR